MIICSFVSHPHRLAPAARQAQALASAIVLRNCALHLQTCGAGRLACRALMRDQALQWRGPRGPR